MASGYETVTFLSDYGRSDEFVGVVHSVIRAIAPHAAVVDLTHDLGAHDVRAGGLMLARSSQYLCPGVVLAVVDPGVGTDRRSLAVEVGDGMSVLVGPDNGLLAPAVAMCGGATRAVELTSTEHRLEAAGPTFAGRDVLAPAAAHLCAGVSLSELGNEIDPATLMPGMLPVAHNDGDDLVGEVLWVDRFGNAQLNVDPDDLEESFGVGEPVELVVGESVRVARPVGTYAEIGAGAVGLVTDSYGLVSVALDRGAASEELGLVESAEVRIRVASEAPGVEVRLGDPRVNR